MKLPCLSIAVCILVKSVPVEGRIGPIGTVLPPPFLLRAGRVELNRSDSPSIAIIGEHSRADPKWSERQRFMPNYFQFHPNKALYYRHFAVMHKAGVLPTDLYRLSLTANG